MLYLEGHQLFVAFHQGNMWQLVDENGKEDCHNLDTQWQPSVSKTFLWKEVPGH